METPNSQVELAILRERIDEIEEEHGKKQVSNQAVKKMIEILEKFLKTKEFICYGGTAINNILPKNRQFYDKDIEIPDYDFYSPTALDTAKELADIFSSNGYKEVEARAGVHHGTYKVFVNFIGIADITYLDPTLYGELKKEAIKVDGIYYSSPDYLRMGVYLELSRPDGDVSRWEKVYKRLKILNDVYPIEKGDCSHVEFQRKMDNIDKKESDSIFKTLRDCLIGLGAVFFGGYATNIYSSHVYGEKLGKTAKESMENPDFDVLLEDIDTGAEKIQKELKRIGIDKINIIEHPQLGEYIPKHKEITVQGHPVAYLYEPVSCHSYNTVKLTGSKNIRVASIETLMAFYLAFLYTGYNYHNRERILCMANYLYGIQQKNRTKKTGLLKRFPAKCYGEQETLDDMRAEKNLMIKRLKPKTREYEEWFLKYIPTGKKGKQVKTVEFSKKIKTMGRKSTATVSVSRVKGKTEKTRTRTKRTNKNKSLKRIPKKTIKRNYS
jgi:hypothetical protein